MTNPFDDPQPPPRAASRDPDDLDGVLDEVVAELRASGQPVGKIAAIKGLRGRRPMGLKDAKEAVEDYGRRKSIESITNPQYEGGGTMIALGLLVVVAIVAVCLWGGSK